MDDLQNGRGIILLKSSLIIGLAAISQGMIHVDKDVTIQGPSESISVIRLEKFFGISVPE